MQEIDSLQINSKQTCDTHKRTRLCFASLSADSSNPFLCTICSVSNKITDPLLSIEEVLIADEIEPIQNWPPGFDSDSYQFLKSKDTQNMKDQMQQGIMKFYQTLKSEINQILLNSEKQQLMELDKIELGSEEVIHIYNSLFKRKELVEIFSNPNFLDKGKYLNLLSSLHETHKKDLKEFSAVIEKKKDIEIQFRVFQENQMDDFLNKIIEKINELSLNIFVQLEKGEGETLQFEEYDFKRYWTYTENEEFQINSKIKEMTLQRRVNEIENKSQFMFQDQKILDVQYLDNQIIQILNDSKTQGVIETYYTYDFRDNLTFSINFNDFISLQHFKVEIVTQDKQRSYSLSKLLSDLSSYLQSNRAIPLEFSLNIKNNALKLTAEGFNRQEDLSNFKKEEISYYLGLHLEPNCDGFQISKFQYL